MGFFDAIINIKNLVTGGSADVNLTIDSPSRHRPFKIQMRTNVADQDLEIDGAYLIIQSIEEVKVPHKVKPKKVEEGEVAETPKEEFVRSSTTTSEQKIELATGEVLKSNQEYVWQTDVSFPNDCQPVYKGKYCKHYYRVKAYIDCYGNDPDSGWITLEMD